MVVTKATAEAVLKVRTGLNLTQEKFAEKIGVTEQTVTAWESGRNTISQRTFEKVKDKLSTADRWTIEDAIKKDKMKRKEERITKRQ